MRADAGPYRMFVDEVGSDSLRDPNNPLDRFLSLTGIMLPGAYAEGWLREQFDDLKARYFPYTDEPIVFHRTVMKARNWPFWALRDPETRSAFEDELVDIFRWSGMNVVTATIDKRVYASTSVARFQAPYHYALKLLVERYVRWLIRQEGRGDIVAEARGQKPDRRLAKEFDRVLRYGTREVEMELMRARLARREIAFHPKSSGLAGLEATDLIAYPSHLAHLAMYDLGEAPTGLDGRIVELLEESLYDRSAGGRIDGWGRKWMP